MSAEAKPPPSPEAEAQQVTERALATSVAFHGAHQAGILTPRQDQATFLALDSIAPNRAELFEAPQALSTEARLLAQGESVGVAPIDDTPPDSEILGAIHSPDG